ncbi:hypothetical protein V8E55_003840 [Tylopilus felleus]
MDPPQKKKKQTSRRTKYSRMIRTRPRRCPNLVIMGISRTRIPMTYQRLRALALYKELHRLGRDYEPSYDFHGKLRKLFEKNRNLVDEAEIERALEFGEYIKNETLALYSLRKYRHLKRMYPPVSTSHT